MKLELLLQFIVPLTFLAIWALTSLLNRDAQPLPQRPGAGRLPGPGPARTGVGGGLSSAPREGLSGPTRYTPAARSAPSVADRTAPARWSSPTAQGRPGAGPPRAVDEGIVILDSEARPAQGSSSFSPSAAASGRTARGSSSAARRTASRARPAPAPPIKPVESERRRALTGLVGQSLAQTKAKPLDIAPLSTPIAPINSVPLTAAGQTPAPEVARTAAKLAEPPLSVDELRAMLASPKRVREVALLGELLQPPVSMRAPRRPR
jgi:hypothetical protein